MLMVLVSIHCIYLIVIVHAFVCVHIIFFLSTEICCKMMDVTVKTLDGQNRSFCVPENVRRSFCVQIYLLMGLLHYYMYVACMITNK